MTIKHTPIVSLRCGLGQVTLVRYKWRFTLQMQSLQGSVLMLPARLHSQRTHWGKSLYPNAQRSHCRPVKPSLHTHWPADTPAHTPEIFIMMIIIMIAIIITTVIMIIMTWHCVVSGADWRLWSSQITVTLSARRVCMRRNLHTHTCAVLVSICAGM